MMLQNRALTETLRFQPWEHLVQLLDDFQNNRRVIVGKARQLGVTWLIAGYSLWQAKFFENAKVLILSQTEDDAKGTIAKVTFIDDNLPEWMKDKRNPDAAGEVGFPETSSIIKALPSTMKAGRGTDATIVVTDEAEYHEYVARNFAAIKPTLSGGGTHIICSTADTLVTEDLSWFKQMYRGAPGNGYLKRFIPWNARPDRDEKWFAEETNGMKAYDIAAEYPLVEEDMLRTLQTMPYFDNGVLESWLPAPHPITCVEMGRHKTVKVWKLPIVGRKYVIYTDPSDGKTDPHATIVKDTQTGEHVATSHGMVPADYCAQIHHDLVLFYNKAANSYEMNAFGGGVVHTKLNDLETPNQVLRLSAEGKKGVNETRYGQFTGKNAKRVQRERAEETIRLQSSLMYDESEILEHKDFFRPEGEDPRAPKGGHDDWVMAHGGVEWIAPYAVAHKIGVSSRQYHG